MIQTFDGSLVYFQFESLARPTIVHGVYSRLGGMSQSPFASLNLSTSVADQAYCVAENRARAYGSFGRSDKTLVHAHLVHKADVACVTSAHHGRVIPMTDALITNDPGCGLTMNFADCAPIFIYDPNHHAIGLGHAGWAGTVRDVPGAMVRAMSAAFGSKPEQLIAAVGPCISGAVYEVGDEVIASVKKSFPEDVGRLLIEQPHSKTGRPHFDLPWANHINFERAGVKSVELSGLCTAQNTHLFFSHRAEGGKTGRFGTIFILGQA